MHDLPSFIEYLKQRVNCEHLSFEKTTYVNRLTPMTITCDVHGDFVKNVTYVKYQIDSGKIGICPSCTIVQRELDRNKTGKGTVYFIRITTTKESFYKLGYTQYDVTNRFTDYSLPGPYKAYDLIYKEEFKDPKMAVERELALHKEFKGYSYTPIEKFYGSNECYEVDIFKINVNEI